MEDDFLQKNGEPMNEPEEDLFDMLATEGKKLQVEFDAYAKVLDAMWLTEAGRLAFWDKYYRLKAELAAQREFIKCNNWEDM